MIEIQAELVKGQAYNEFIEDLRWFSGLGERLSREFGQDCISKLIKIVENAIVPSFTRREWLTTTVARDYFELKIIIPEGHSGLFTAMRARSWRKTKPLTP